METREAAPSNFLIKINSFSLLGSCGMDKYETKKFIAGDYKWKLIIYPCGDKNVGKDGDYVSVYLAMADTSSLVANTDVNVVFTIFLYNQISNNYLHSLGITRRFHAIKSEWGISKFISKKVLSDPSHGYLVDDNCVFGAEVFVVRKEAAVIERLSLKNVVTPYKRNWKIPNFSKLGDIWKSEEFNVGRHKWNVHLYPKGYGDASGRSVSVYLYHIGSERVQSSITICIKNQVYDNEHKKLTITQWFPASDRLSKNSACGWSSFIELANTSDPKKGFIVYDCCLLDVEISVHAVSH
ncbi:PREDICTED: uncharacterized protein LOC105953872 [Erythranthe guttata]|uniref:uncharacterized protein LOC105953872 n=1 Tax=Erythranthe guttata TaxID=4155 RepID=UPI00064E0C17|nr:PREDICTED: uncharacterized protein LOC105953872 [Erythranthe guttata]|eukprot:XP_012833006.1 PREDICTED: uncharacterized protein LOC105953872 [Erythranthe guttata]